MKEGEGFGEIALKTESNRTTSIIAKKKCKMVVFSK